MVKNPIIPADFPDPDVIRVGDTYYMASTTMFLMPGGDILESKDLVHWDIAAHVFDTLGNDDEYELKNGKHAYARGMWAPSLRYDNGTFYLVFACNERPNSLLFTATDAKGPWKMQEMDGFFYDSSLFFDEDGKVYIVHGNTIVRITELDRNTWGPKEGGLQRILIQDEPGQPLGFEGSHLYKLNGKYYLFTCHMPKEEEGRKTECCFISDTLEGEFVGKTIINDPMGYKRKALQVAQGGVVDDPEGNLYMFMFQDRGAVGRLPMIFPMKYDYEGYPVPATSGVVPQMPSDDETPLNEWGRGHFFDDESFDEGSLSELLDKKKWWQVSHNIDEENICLVKENGVNALRIKTGAVTSNLLKARNTLTQRCVETVCTGEITVDGKALNDGDYAGISAYNAHYGAIALSKADGKLSLVKIEADADNDSVGGDKDFYERDPKITTICELPDGVSSVRLKVTTDFNDAPDFCTYSYDAGNGYVAVDGKHNLYFKLDLFIGARFGLFAYSTKACGGYADFSDFKISAKD
ncbi:glycoside hydrolase family 43 protein [Butyrivibrio sp. AE3006]|uniref:glycoside hydrolase family 43 protein n=1 Tax=Butyrivibrio sp. AE3006 TaxID=1280673 RepID=UPI0003F51E24|nr:glycoside hydrolase 43 family protein [Butyrivibrio sp. AE3006]